jgi:hypothetical protein
MESFKSSKSLQRPFPRLNPFTPGDLNGDEISRIATTCGFFQAQGSGNGICNSCEIAGQGAAASNQ